MRTDMDGTCTLHEDRSSAFQSLRVHLIGVGGAGMNAAAKLLLHLGADVSGTDQVPFEGMGNLVTAGARIAIGHESALIDRDLDLVVASAAIPPDNRELRAAQARGIPVIKYAELVGRLMRCFREGTAIAGTHGKSTTTAMCAFLCREAGLDPGFLVGAESRQLGGQCAHGCSERFIVEACEFDRSFLELSPESAAILNIDNDHLDYYRDIEEITSAFAAFASRVSPEGLLVYPSADPATRRAASTCRATTQSFGFDVGADWRALNLRPQAGCYSFVVQYGGSTVISSRLSIPGRYNVGNALAAIALAYHAGASFESLEEALPKFEGVQRRMSWRGNGRGVTIVDDYAHHPTEIRATLEAVRSRYEPKRTWVVFQPHQHARTMHLMQDFAVSFGGADEIVIPEVYGARAATDRSSRDGSAELARRICESGVRARYLPTLDDAAEHVMQHVEPGDLVVTMGAGDVWKVADVLVSRICEPDRV